MNTIPIYKRCSRCNERITSGTTCTCVKTRYKEYDRSRDKNTDNFYHSKEWKQTRKYILDLDQGIDVYIYLTRNEIVAADTVHHIVPLAEDWGNRTNDKNLISLNHDTHSMIEQYYKNEKQKERLIKELKEMITRHRGR